jgi:hypothetical protein
MVHCRHGIGESRCGVSCGDLRLPVDLMSLLRAYYGIITLPQANTTGNTIHFNQTLRELKRCGMAPSVFSANQKPSGGISVLPASMTEQNLGASRNVGWMLDEAHL